jgi:hypothetical protein
MTTLRYDGHSSKTAITFITEFEAMLDRYKEQQTDPRMVLTELFQKTLLQNAVADVSMLLDVSNQDKQAMAWGASSLNWHEYLHLVKSAASMYDRRKLGAIPVVPSTKLTLYRNERTLILPPRSQNILSMKCVNKCLAPP